MTQRQALDILKTGASVFLTGEPGSGKTHTVNEYIRYLKAVRVTVAVTASTGIAATHIGGMTIHSWSGIGIKTTLSEYDVDRIASTERIARRIRKTAVLIIDEVSMIDGDVLASVDKVCREVKQIQEPFGGLQVVLVGDFFQLPPVSSAQERPAQFSFESPLWIELQLIVCYLTEQHRQEDKEFVDVLAALRKNALSGHHYEHLNSRCVAQAEAKALGITKLFSHNVDVDRINNEELQKISGPSKTFRMAEHGPQSLVEQLQRGCLSPQALVLKPGAVVMFTKNSPKGIFVNGTLGTVTDFKYGSLPLVTTKSGRRVVVEPMDWTIEDGGRVRAHISQLPLRLAWAITVHKSQGMSLDAAFIDLRDAFVAGQGYVALSRVRSLSGLFLAGYNQQALAVHSQVLVRDEDFRAQAQAVAAEFGKVSEKELHRMQANFIRVAGGNTSSPAKSYSVALIRTAHPKAYRSWDEQEIQALIQHHCQGKNIAEISQLLGRQPGAIRARLQKIELEKRIEPRQY